MTADADAPKAETADGITEVEIFGTVYRVRKSDDEEGSEHLREVAALVDRKMREISQQARSSDAGRLAILAALNLADELLQSQSKQVGERVEIKERVATLTGELADALDR